MNLDPVTSGWIPPDCGVATVAGTGPRPPRPRDAQVDHSWGLQMCDLPAADEQGRLVTVAGAALVRLAAGEHGGDKRVPPLVILAL